MLEIEKNIPMDKRKQDDPYGSTSLRKIKNNCHPPETFPRQWTEKLGQDKELYILPTLVFKYSVIR